MDDTIAAVATPPGQGAVALIRVSGPDALVVAERVFRGELGAPRVQTYGSVIDRNGGVIDDVLLTVFRGPASYTGEDCIEIGCHGGMLVTKQVLEAVLAAGARPAEPGEFSKRAFLSGKMDLTQAEAVMDLISARSALALRAARGQLEGRLGARVEELRAELLETLAHIEAHIDFPDEDIDPSTSEAIASRLRDVAAGATALASTGDAGRILREGLIVVISGPPNAGKSSLLNALLGFDRAIVSPSAGTTRDTIEESISLGGLPVRLIDTAGMRQSDDLIEREGVERAGRERERADIVLEVFDRSVPKPDGYVRGGSNSILVLHKSDLDEDESWAGEQGLPVSSLEGEGMDDLVQGIVERAGAGGAAWGDDLVTVNARHRAWLEKCAIAAGKAVEGISGGASPEFIAVDAREALDAVGEIVGKADVEELLGSIFSQFCIGK